MDCVDPDQSILYVQQKLYDIRNIDKFSTLKGPIPSLKKIEIRPGTKE